MCPLGGPIGHRPIEENAMRGLAADESRYDPYGLVLEVYDDEWTLDELVSEVADWFPVNWAMFWGIGTPSPTEIGDEDDEFSNADELYRAIYHLVSSAASLSRRKLPDDRRAMPRSLKERSEQERAAWNEAAGNLREVYAEEPEKPGLADVLQFLEGQSPAERTERFFRGTVETLAWQEFGYLPSELAERLLRLLEFSVLTKSERTQAYLRRVARCFILDLGPELAVMCRAVVEASLEHLDLEEAVNSVLERKNKKGHPGLVDWLDAASDVGLLDDGGRRAAENIRTSGNDAIHAAPDLARSPVELMQDLTEVLEQLGPRGR